MNIESEKFEMPIRSESDLGDPPQQAPNANRYIQNAYIANPADTLRMTCVTCKICDRGTLRSKKVFRLSGPAVAIGYILLIPSIIGMIFCAILFISINSRDGDKPRAGPSEPWQSASDANFRNICGERVKMKFLSAGISEPRPTVEKWCECQLTTSKETGSLADAAQTCNQQMNDGTLKTPSQEVDVFYPDDIPGERRNSEGYDLVRGIGSTFTLTLGIAFFVGGLLGWLLVMKKLVLQCNVCGAVVNAS